MIHLRNVTKYYGHSDRPSLQDVTLSVHDGETLALVGSSGGGKTTLLKLINRLLTPEFGRIEIDGQNVSALDPVSLRRSMGYVFQGVGLFPHLTVEENIALPLKIQGVTKDQRRAQAEYYMELVQLEPADDGGCYPRQLSGGQKQRAAVARALVHDPKYLLMDEPFGALDAITRYKLQELVASLRDQLHKTIVIVTHDIAEAKRLGDRIAVMHNGLLLQVGPYETLCQIPEHDFVTHLLNSQNAVDANA